MTSKSPEEVSRLINRRRFAQAYNLASRLRDDLQVNQSPEFWLQLSLAANLTGRAAVAEQSLRRAQDLGATELQVGDALRDHALRLIRLGDLEEAEKLIRRVEELHQNDPNRAACIMMVRGRWCRKAGSAQEARLLHITADKKWRELGTDADRQWMYNNYIHWLTAVVASGGDKSTCLLLRTKIESECPPGAKNRSGEAQIMLLPRVGLKLYDTAQWLSMQKQRWS